MVPQVSQFLLSKLCINIGKPKRREIPGSKARGRTSQRPTEPEGQCEGEYSSKRGYQVLLKLHKIRSQSIPIPNISPVDQQGPGDARSPRKLTLSLSWGVRVTLLSLHTPIKRLLSDKHCIAFIICQTLLYKLYKC